MITIKKWYGRLGNNIIQLITSIQTALYYKTNISIPDHPFFNVNLIEQSINNFSSNSCFDLEDNFFFRNHRKAPPIDKEVYLNNEKEAIDLVKEAFLKINLPILDKNTIVIHIRSGDIFRQKPHPKYCPPPLSYYTNIIENSNFKKIILISQDTKNPIVECLLNMYPQALYKKNKLIDDIAIILGAKTVVKSVGTFIPQLLKLSNNIEKIYRPKMFSKELKNYYLKNRPWKRTPQQLDNLLNYVYPIHQS